MYSFISLHVIAAGLLHVFLGAALAAENGYEKYAEVDPVHLNKSSAKLTFDTDTLVATKIRLAALVEVSPGQAVGRPLQALVLPSPSEINEHAQYIQAVRSRIRFNGVYSDAEMQILKAAIKDMQSQKKSAEFRSQGAIIHGLLEQLYCNGCAVDDLTALEQRRALCDLLHPLCGTGDRHSFYYSSKAKQFMRRKIHLQEIEAPKGIIPHPAPVRESTNNF